MTQQLKYTVDVPRYVAVPREHMTDKSHLDDDGKLTCTHESCGKDTRWRHWRRVKDGTETRTLTLTVDYTEIVFQLSRKAAANLSGKSASMGGAIKARLT